MQAYKKLEERFSDYTALKSIDALLNWDASVMMPEQGVAQRARQAAVLGVKMHTILTDADTGQWIQKAQDEKLDAWQAANLNIMQRLHAHATALTPDMVAKRKKQESKTEMVWRAARAADDFSMVKPELEALLAIVRETAEMKSQKLGLSPYDALLDSFAPDMRAAEVDAIFDDLAAFLPGVLEETLRVQKRPIPVSGPFPADAQEKLSHEVAKIIGFDFSRGRLDISTHPFSSGIGNDVRITTRYNENNLLGAMRATMHEAGHAFFDQNTPKEWQHQPVGISNNMGMAIHESQSLSLDMQLGCSIEFFELIAPCVQKAFGGSGPAWSAENLQRMATEVSRGLIRVEADEVSYPLHVILRYRLERQLVSGDLKIGDLPAAWNDGMQKLVGITPPNDAQGCMQDIHWYTGYYGYFPSYALGALLAAQLVDKMQKDIPDVFARVQKGDIASFNGWLRKNVHEQGCLYSPAALVEKATGSKMSPVFLKRHLSRRYLGREYKGA